MRTLSLVFGLSLLLTSGCDTGGVSDNCASVNVRSGGTISARVGSESLRLTCYDVIVVEDRTLLLGYEVGSGPADVLLPITIAIGGTTARAYSLDGIGSGDDGEGSDGDESFIQLSLGGDATSPAESGSIRVEEFSATRLRGTFEFVTLTGIDVSDGRFDVSVSGIER